MKDIRLAIILALDYFDHYVLDHRFYWACCWIATHDWWGDE